MDVKFEGELNDIQKKIDESWKVCRSPEDIDTLTGAQMIVNVMKSHGIEKGAELLSGIEGVEVSGIE